MAAVKRLRGRCEDGEYDAVGAGVEEMGRQTKYGGKMARMVVEGERGK